MHNHGGYSPQGPGYTRRYPGPYQQLAGGPDDLPPGPFHRPEKKKAWPWVVGGILLTFVVFLGGCIYVVTSAVQSVNDLGMVEDEIEGLTTTMFSNASDGDFAMAGTVADGEGGCVTAEALTQQLTDLAPTAPATITDSAFFARNGTSTASKNADEDFVVDGRRSASAGQVSGNLDTTTGNRTFTVLLVEGSSGWRVCEVSVP